MSLLQRAATRLNKYAKGLPASFNFDKSDLIDFAYRSCSPAPTSFADLGGMWNVNGAYTFYTLREYGATKAFVADTDLPEAAIQEAKSWEQLKLIQGSFGEEAVAEQIGKVDAIFMFDVLLHQVKPDWNEVLKTYAKRTNYFVIYNQQWVGSENTVRLFDLGEKEYFENVPHAAGEPPYNDLFSKLDEIHPQHNRIWRDVHNVWQWGITDRDLIQTVENLGFKLKYQKGFGNFATLKNFENHAFVFQKG